MTYLGTDTVGNVYCKSYQITVESSTMLSSYVSLMSYGPGAAYEDVSITVNGAVIGVQYQNTPNASVGFSVSTSATAMLDIGFNAISVCLRINSGVTSSFTNLGVSYIN